jgi:NADPH2:quinone reductase
MMRKAIRIHCYGGPDVMRLEELPVPVPGPAQALVRVCAASVNFLDIQKRRGELVGQAFYQCAAGVRRRTGIPRNSRKPGGRSCRSHRSRG